MSEITDFHLMSPREARKLCFMNGETPKPALRPKSKTRPPKLISFAGAGFLALLATLAGGAIGWIGPHVFKNTQEADAFTQTIQTLRNDLQTETKARLALESTLKASQKSIRDNAGQFQNNASSLNTLNNQLTQFESLKTEITSLQERLDTQDTERALESGGEAAENNAGVQALLERITALETQTENLQNNQTENNQTTPAFPTPDANIIELPHTQNLQDKAETLRILQDSFPRVKMLQAIHAQDVIAAKQSGWISRMLSKHIKVRDDNTPALTTLSMAETALKSGDIVGAITHVNKLNPPVRLLAKDWVIAAQSAEKSLRLQPSSQEQ